MSKEKIKYVKHPVTAEKKAELRKQGYKIIDARFDPDRKDEPKKDEDKSAELETLKKEADELGVKYPKNIRAIKLKEKIAEAKAAE